MAKTTVPTRPFCPFLLKCSLKCCIFRLASGAKALPMTEKHSITSIFSGSARPSVSAHDRSICNASAHIVPQAKRTFSESSQGDSARLAREAISHSAAQLPSESSDPDPPVSKAKRRKGHGERPPQTPLPDYNFKIPQSKFQLQLPQIKSDGSKRSLSGSDIPVLKGNKSKRLRLADAALNLPHSLNLADSSLPPSPLFFSHSAHLRPAFPPRYSSSEAAAKMLSKAKGEEPTIKTVTLARGSYMGSSPPTSYPSSRSRTSTAERSTPARRISSEPFEKAEQQQLLNGIGITELLDLDDRPIFVVDLADSSNYSTGSLDIIFANSSLVSCGNLLDALLGKVDDVSSNPFAPKPLSQFKEWVLSNSTSGDSYSGGVPAFIEGSMSWTASTLRRRLRVVSGTFTSDGSRRTSSSLGQSVTLEAHHAPLNSAGKASVDSVDLNDPVGMLRYQEPPDYFGNARVPDVSVTTPDTPITQKDFQPAIAETIEPTSANSKMDEQLPHRMPPEISNLESVLSAASASNFDSFSTITPPEKGIDIFDWTRIPEVENLPPHIRFARSVDWASTPLGPIEDWSADLRQMVSIHIYAPPSVLTRLRSTSSWHHRTLRQCIGDLITWPSTTKPMSSSPDKSTLNLWVRATPMLGRRSGTKSRMCLLPQCLRGRQP